MPSMMPCTRPLMPSQAAVNISYMLVPTDPAMLLIVSPIESIWDRTQLVIVVHTKAMPATAPDHMPSKP